MEEIYSREEYLEYINLIIDAIDEFIIAKPELQELDDNANKIKEFKSMKQFILEIDDDNIYKNIVDQLKTLITAASVPENFEFEEVKYLAVVYFLLLKIDLNKTLSIDPNQMYLTMNSMRCSSIPYKSYQECIDKLTYPRLVEIIKSEGPTGQIRIILNGLTDEISKSEKEYNPNKLDDDMQQFIAVDVYTRITPPMTGEKNSGLLLKLHADKIFNLKNIRNAERVNNNLYQQEYVIKLDSLDQYDKMEFDFEMAQVYLDVIEYLKTTTQSKAFAMTKLELTTLKAMEYIDIKEFEVEDLSELILKLETLPIDNYEELFSKKKLK